MIASLVHRFSFRVAACSCRFVFVSSPAFLFSIVCFCRLSAEACYTMSGYDRRNNFNHGRRSSYKADADEDLNNHDDGSDSGCSDGAAPTFSAAAFRRDAAAGGGGRRYSLPQVYAHHERPLADRSAGDRFHQSTVSVQGKVAKMVQRFEERKCEHVSLISCCNFVFWLSRTEQRCLWSSAKPTNTKSIVLSCARQQHCNINTNICSSNRQQQQQQQQQRQQQTWHSGTDGEQIQ